MGLVHGVNRRPLVCWVSSARSADAREARFLVELKFKRNAVSTTGSSIWYSKIEVSIGRSLKKAKGEEKVKKKKEEKKLFMAFRGKAKMAFHFVQRKVTVKILLSLQIVAL